MAPNAVCLTAQTRLALIRVAFLTIKTDHSLGLRLCHYQCLHHALLLPEHGPGLPGLGVLVVGYWSFLVSDF